jgi:hypothetical protein
MFTLSSSSRGKTRIGAALATAAVGLGVSFGAGVAPASANTACTDSYSPVLCLWEHATPPANKSDSGTGRAVAFKRGSSNLHKIRFGDAASQIDNNTSRDFCVYEHIDYKGKVRVIGAGRSANFSADWWNDKVSSLRAC